MAQGNLSLAAGLWKGVGKGWADHAAASMCMTTCRPAAVAILTAEQGLTPSPEADGDAPPGSC